MSKITLTKISGIGPATARILTANGFSTAAKVAAAEIPLLADLPGLGPARAAAVISAARQLVEKTEAETRSAETARSGQEKNRRKSEKSKRKKKKKKEKKEKKEKKKKSKLDKKKRRKDRKRPEAKTKKKDGKKKRKK